MLENTELSVKSALKIGFKGANWIEITSELTIQLVNLYYNGRRGLADLFRLRFVCMGPQAALDTWFHIGCGAKNFGLGPFINASLSEPAS